MDSVVRNVCDLSSGERHVYESVLGQPLRDDQRVVVQIIDTPALPNASTTDGINAPLLPYAIWSGLSNAEIADLESVILQRSDSRSI